MKHHVVCQFDEGRVKVQVTNDVTVDIDATVDDPSVAFNSGVYRCEIEVFALANSKAIR
jgi:hypothetical protein